MLFGNVIVRYEQCIGAQIELRICGVNLSLSYYVDVTHVNFFSRWMYIIAKCQHDIC